LIASIFILFVHLLGLLNLDLILAITWPTLIIGGQLDDLAYLLERKKPLSYNKYGKISLTLGLLMNMVGLAGGLITLLIYNLILGVFLIIGGVIGNLILAKTLRLNKLLSATNINSKNVNNDCKKGNQHL
jgi:hypothetical protein